MRRIESLNRVLPFFYGPLLALLLVLFAWLPLRGGFDVWAHAAIGSWIWSHGQVPTQSLFLWGAPPIPWVWHSWLSQLFFFGLMRFGALFGANGGPFVLATFTLICVALCFVLLWKLWRRNAPPSAIGALCFAVAMWLSAPRFQPRQEAISAVLLVVVLAYLIAWSRRHIGGWDEGSARSEGYFDPVAFGIVGLFALWVNLHALFAVGLAVMIVTAICAALQDRFDQRSRALLVIAALCVAATFLNPYFGGVWQAINVLKPNSQAQFVDEWRSPLTHLIVNGQELTPFMREYVVVLLLLSGIALLAWLRNGQRRWAHFAWLVMANALFLMHRRDIWLATILVMAAMCANANYLSSGALWNWWRRASKQSQTLDVPVGMRVLARCGAVLCLLLWAATLFSTRRKKLIPLHAVEQVPSGAANFIEKRRLPGRIFNDYEYSSYLQWRWNGVPRKGEKQIPTRGRRPLYIDLMNDYPDGVLTEYLAVMNGVKSALPFARQSGGQHRDSGAAQTRFRAGEVSERQPEMAPRLQRQRRHRLVATRAVAGANAVLSACGNAESGKRRQRKIRRRNRRREYSRRASRQRGADRDDAARNPRSAAPFVAGKVAGSRSAARRCAE